MNAKTALIKALLDGRVLNIKNVFETIGLTNCPREISRMVEKPFGVVVSRVDMNGTSRYGSPVSWVNYRLNSTPMNKPGIQKMREYLAEHWGNPKSEPKKLIQQDLF